MGKEKQKKSMEMFSTNVQVVFDLRPARLTTAQLYDCLDHTEHTIIFALIHTCIYEIQLTTTPTYDQMVRTERGRKSNTICIY